MRFDVRLGTPQVVGELFTVVPIVLPHVTERRSVTLGEALERGVARVADTRSVERASIEVGDVLPVLVLEGEILVGGFQNRVVNVSVLLEPKETQWIPVSCVERGRYYPLDSSQGQGLASRDERNGRERVRVPGRILIPILIPPLPGYASGRRSRGRRRGGQRVEIGGVSRQGERQRQQEGPVNISCFRLAPSLAPVGLRHTKVASVAVALRWGDARADQQAVWEGVEQYLLRGNAESPTRDITAVISKQLPAVEAWLESVQPLEGQVGVVVAIDSTIVGLEAVEHPETWRRVAKRILGSYALEALSRQAQKRSRGRKRALTLEEFQAFLERVSRAFSRAKVVRPPVGLGRYELPRGERLRGFALVHEEVLYHLVVFPSRR